jgi:hypothetical protein
LAIAILLDLGLGAFLTIVTGVVLMCSVYKIRKFYQENDLKEELNGRFLDMHALAFVLFTISVIPANISFALQILKP